MLRPYGALDECVVLVEADDGEKSRYDPLVGDGRRDETVDDLPVGVTQPERL